MPRSVELFAGGGGMALGMHNAGFEHDQLVERDPRACHILRVNAERTPRLWKPENIREMDVMDWIDKLEEVTPSLANIDLVAGGPPCQPFSISGVHAGHNDERNMFPAAIEIVRRLRPKTFVFENVPGLLRSGFLPYYDYIYDQLTKPEVTPKGNETWEHHHRRVSRARESGLVYRVYRQTINAADLGVPQVRQRVFLIGIRTDMPHADWWTKVPATHGLDPLIYDQWITGTYWLEHGIRRPKECPDQFERRVREMRNQKELDVPRLARWQTTRDALKNPERLPDPNSRKSHNFLNHWAIPGARTYKGHTGGPIDWPAKTLKAGVHGVCGGEAMIRFNDESVRYLTIREAARVQSFPDDYDLPGTRTTAMRALGNAVAVKVAESIGIRLRKLMEIWAH